MKCPKCKQSITESFDPDTIVTCPGCGSRLMTRAAALRSQGGPKKPQGPPPDPEGTRPSVKVPPAEDQKEPKGARSKAAAEAKGAEGRPGPTVKDEPRGTAATLEAILRELEMLRATQMQILDIVGRGKSIPPPPVSPDETQVLSPVRSRRRKTVLLVDDDPKTREAAEAELKQADVPVRSVGEGNAALAAVAEEKPDVIVLELGLGGEMGGRDLINMIKATMEWVDVPIILWTREGVSTQKEAREQHGADEVVTKSSGPGALVARVITVFRSG